MRTVPMLLTLMLTLNLTLLWTPCYATSCPNDPENAERYETLKQKAGDSSTSLQRLYDALAKKIKEACELRDQRNKFDAELQQAQTDRDRQASRADEQEQLATKERATSDERLVENVTLHQRIAELEKRPGWLKGGALGAALGAAATVGAFFIVKAATR